MCCATEYVNDTMVLMEWIQDEMALVVLDPGLTHDLPRFKVNCPK